MISHKKLKESVGSLLVIKSPLYFTPSYKEALIGRRMGYDYSFEGGTFLLLGMEETIPTGSIYNDDVKSFLARHVWSMEVSVTRCIDTRFVSLLILIDGIPMNLIAKRNEIRLLS